jgi:c-di-GMP-binding flagellar brake protein YcgR
MSLLFPVEADPRVDVIGQAVADSRPVVATWRQSDGWATIRTRFVGADPRSGELLLEYPNSSERPAPEIADGQSVSVSFRRGRGRCVFSTMMLGRSETWDGETACLPTLRLVCPRELSQLQRRLYHRETVSPTTAISVELWAEADSSEASGEPDKLTGILLDISREGIGVVLPPGRRFDAEPGQVCRCSFRPHEDQAPILLCVRLCDQSRLANGCVRVGLRFAGSGLPSQDGDTAERLAQFLTRTRV